MTTRFDPGFVARQFRLDGKIALITGGRGALAEAIAAALADLGCDIALASRHEKDCEETAAGIAARFGHKAIGLRCDISKEEEVEAAVGATVERLGKLDILVNNAGASFPKKLENHTDEDMAGSFALNYSAVFWAMRAAFPHMKAQGFGRVINLGSLNGVNAHMFTTAYNASKEAVRALSRTAAVEWGGHGITINVICPSAASPQAKDYFEANPEMLTKILEQVPAGRIGDAEKDIGAIAVFLASEGSGYLNGNTLFADGGAHINGVAWRPAVED